MSRRRWLWALGAVVLTAALAPMVAVFVWDSRSASLRKQLDWAVLAPPDVFSAAELAGLELPEPVEHHFLSVLKDGQPLIRTVDLTTEGEFQTGTTDAEWRLFRASQRFSTEPPGFVWDARIQMAPFAPVYIRDAYVGGHTEMRGRVLGLFPVVDESGTAALAAGQLHRYLAETIWFPTALLPGHNDVSWQAIDARSAMATLTDRGVAVSLRFTFTPEGNVSEVFAAERMRAVDGRYEPTPWAVRCDTYQVREGVRIPTWCEAEWRLPAGPLPYWRGHVTSVSYGFSR